MESGPTVDADLLRNERVVLMPITPDDHRYLYWLATAGDNAIRWRYRLQLPPFELFVQQLHSDVLAQFVVLDRSNGERTGHVVAYSPDLRSGTTFVGCLVAPEKLGEGLGKAALDVFGDYLFQSWPFRKIYAEVPDFTFEHFEKAEHEFGTRPSGQWTYEGTLKEHLYVAGKYWDVHTVSRRRVSE